MVIILGIFEDMLIKHEPSVDTQVKDNSETEQTQKKEGYLWINLLVKFDTDGSAVIVRSFTSPAKDSFIKKLKKEKEEKQKLNINIKRYETPVDLF